MSDSGKMDVYLEVGKKRTFASAVQWPGWGRSGRDEASALQALFDAGPRYERVLASTPLGFASPTDLSAFNVIERLEGNATTDFGAPNIVPAYDTSPVDDADLRRLRTLLKAGWRAFDEAVSAATGKELRLGPRGGGRDLEGIIQHVLGADAGDLAKMGRKVKTGELDLAKALADTRHAILKALTASARGEVPARGPRGGVRWPPRFFVRAVAWHLLDHIWEIEDRVLAQ
ncbi:MAG: hypothetical protein H0T73_22740 [Ardenticatenales bacterium]|nr:hypothetical protein [Ardenticatenales bacterium]